MTLDQVTEMVAHMIGIFHLDTEDQRLRDEYASFRALDVKSPDIDPVSPISFAFTSPYELGDFAPRLAYADSPPPAPPLEPLWPNRPYFENPVQIGIAAPADLPVVKALYTQPISGGAAPAFRLEPPGAVAVVTLQMAVLFDDDIILMGDGLTTFVDPAVYLEALGAYHAHAEGVTAGLGADALMPGPNAQASAIHLHSLIGAFDGSQMATTSEHTAHGAQAFGTVQNGEAATDLVRLDDVMPAYLKAKAGRDGDEEGAAAPDPFAGLAKSDAPLPYRPDIDAHNLVVAGGNSMVNQVAINSAWLDAPVIAVMGDVIHLNAIMQTNLMVQHTAGAAGGVMPSASINSAAMSVASSLAPEEGDEPDGSGAPTLPSNWAVTRIEGDLIALNHVSQYSFQTDHDRAEITFGSSDLFLGLGDNTIVNLTTLSQLGFGYDLIIVGGAMITVNWIDQVNVLLDNDAITYSGAGILAGVRAGDNLLFNGAQITGIGLDQYGEMSAPFAAAGESLAAGGTTIDADVARDSLFEGVDLLRVLYIEGDLTTVNWLEQTNVLGDSDQVHQALGEFQTATGAAAEIITGSNALINLASITQFGTDSAVMVGGEVYDDALLYQAELIDTDADPLGTQMPPLTPGAVAFLADGMLEPDLPQLDTAITPTPAEGHASPDLMQTMLA
ncbi:type I secretion protein ATPase [Pelagivirga sediminicola]|uniref:Type I secretion protein ATPase n=1 Tax=Pelagivirga sediminicola TaxID=2170575 RepID=A0A2T7G8H3_9RHOB|nr:type I secretion protein ATPase [Pelagivirga sediminicola]PVA10719.1 type I secretion protein ATPase [Pelagivirga sediminicola]